MNAFITGSKAYGTPTPESDLDLVVLVDFETYHAIDREIQGKDAGLEFKPIRFGTLNLILTQDPVDFAMWKVATEMMKREARYGKPSTRERAMRLIDGLRKKLGIDDRHDSGDD